MKFTTKALVAGLILAGGMALAAATDPDAVARQALMGAQGGAMKVLGGMAGGEVAFDATAAAAAVKTLVDSSAAIEATFTNKGGEDMASHAKPEIWTSWDDFLAKAKALNAAATAIDASSLDGIKAGMGAVGGACKDCHTTYKAS
jgi:cytochrome c556